ncbi:MAG: hypothetical protein KC983_00730 [Phycisphaerales bacterium]|nr:hypothetical protein [Phycisphaerales bacterium]
MMRIRRDVIGVAFGSAAILSSTAFAQVTRQVESGDERALDSRIPELRDKDRPTITWSLQTGAEYHDEVSLDAGGDIESWAAGLALATNITLNRDARLTISGAYVYEQFDFAGTSGFGSLNPWENVHTFEASARFAWDVTNDVTMFAGPVFVFSGEDGSKTSDSIMGGGFIGATYQVNDELIIGGGVGATTWLEDDVRLFPIIILEWRFTDTMRITSSNYAIRRGVEFQWDAMENVTLGVGAAYSERRFRLDDNGLGPNGVGEVQKFPLYAKVSWRPNDDANIDLLLGSNFSGSVEFLDNGGNTLGASDFDTQLFAGINVGIRW